MVVGLVAQVVLVVLVALVVLVVAAMGKFINEESINSKIDQIDLADHGGIQDIYESNIILEHPADLMDTEGGGSGDAFNEVE